MRQRPLLCGSSAVVIGHYDLRAIYIALFLSSLAV